MCIPSQMSVLGSVIGNAAKITTQIYQQNETNKINSIKQQIALKEIEEKENSAKELMQDGIEEKREKRIEYLKELSNEKAKSAKSGFDLSSTTIDYSFSDIFDLGEFEAQKIENSYQEKAQKLIEETKKDKLNLSLYNEQNKKNNVLNALGLTSFVADGWFDKSAEDNYVRF